MPDQEIQPWIFITGHMTDAAYRTLVVRMALEHLPKASNDLKKFACNELNKEIMIRGFRSIEHAPVPAASKPVAQRMQTAPGVATAIICLWAEAQQALIGDLKSAAESAHLSFVADWSWKTARDGFIDLDEIPALSDFVHSLIKTKTHLEADQLLLAAFWLSRAFIGQADVSTESPGNQPTSQDTVDSAGQESPENVAGEAAAAFDDAEIDSQIKGLSLEQITAWLQERKQAIEQRQQKVLAQGEALVAAARDLRVGDALQQAEEIQGELEDWQGAWDRLVQDLLHTAKSLQVELERRSDLEAYGQAMATLEDIGAKTLSPWSGIGKIETVLAYITEYDQKRHAILERLAEAKKRQEQLQAEIDTWSGNVTRAGAAGIPGAEIQSDEISLAAATKLLEDALTLNRQIEAHAEELRRECISSISAMFGDLGRSALAEDAPVFEGRALGDLHALPLDTLTNARLRDLHATLFNLVANSAEKEDQTATAANALYNRWDRDELFQMLIELARRQRDAENLLLLLAANAAHWLRSAR